MAWHRRLIALRRSVPELADGDRHAVRVHCAAETDDRLLLIERGPVTVAVNVSTVSQQTRLSGAGMPSPTGILAAWGPVTLDDGVLTVPGRGVAVVG